MTRFAPLFVAAALVVGLVPSVQAGPVDTFDVDILTASRYGLDKVDHWRPCRSGLSRGAHGDCDYRAESLIGGRF